MCIPPAINPAKKQLDSGVRDTDNLGRQTGRLAVALDHQQPSAFIVFGCFYLYFIFASFPALSLYSNTVISLRFYNRYMDFVKFNPESN